MAAPFATIVLILDIGRPGGVALALVFCASLVTITLTDLDRRVIPNRVLLACAIAAVAISAGSDPSSLMDRGLAALAAGGFLFLIALVSPRGMGMGDVKLAAVMGLYLRAAVGPAILIGFGAGAAIGLAMIVRHGPAARRRAIPFGPFLGLGGIVALWFGDAIVGWYLGTFFHG